MKTVIKYSILRYIHSRVFNEVVNVGVLVEYHDQSKYELFVPSDLSRLSQLYPDFRPSFLKSYLSALKDRTNQLNKVQLDIEDFKSDARSYILRPDDTSLEFGDTRIAQIKDQALIPCFVAGFVPNLLEEQIKSERHDEVYIRNKFYRSLSTVNGIENKIKKDQEITYNNLSFKVDFVWQNGTTNLVKAISFDLNDSSTFNNKIAQTVGYINHFDGYLAQNNGRFDILLAHPSNKANFHDYDRALKIIESIPVSKKIVEEEGIVQYAQNAIEYFTNN